MDDDERYKGCERLPVSCPSCSHSGIYEGMKCNAEGTNLSAGFKCEDIGGKADCQGMLAGTTSTGHNRYLANRVTSAVRHYVREYYACPYQCEEPSCRFETQDIVGGGAGEPALPALPRDDAQENHSDRPLHAAQLPAVRARLGRLSALGVPHSKSLSCGTFARARTALKGPKRRFPARADTSSTTSGSATTCRRRPAQRRRCRR